MAETSEAATIPNVAPTSPTAVAHRSITTFATNDDTITLTVPISKGLLTSVVFSKAFALVENTGAQICETGLPENYGVSVVLTNSAVETCTYTVKSAYAGAIVFFPYASSATATPPVSDGVATLCGVSGRQLAFGPAGTYTVAVKSPSADNEQ